MLSRLCFKYCFVILGFWLRFLGWLEEKLPRPSACAPRRFFQHAYQQEETLANLTPDSLAQQLNLRQQWVVIYLGYAYTQLPLVTFTREVLQLEAPARQKALRKIQALEQNLLTLPPSPQTGLKPPSRGQPSRPPNQKPRPRRSPELSPKIPRPQIRHIPSPTV